MHDDYRYHLDMTLKTLEKFKFPNRGDTRNYLDVDEPETKILINLIKAELHRRYG